MRDVALDQAEQQLEESENPQTVIVLPQGGLHSQFGKEGEYTFDAGQYAADVVDRLVRENVWKKKPEVGRVSMAGHSGAGATLAKMARESVKFEASKKPGTSAGAAPLTGDLVLFDAINGNELGAFTAWATMRLDQDLAALQGKSETDQLKYLETSQKLLAFHSVDYDFTDLEKAINHWFEKHAAELKPLGPLANCLCANFSVVGLPVHHEELMRGVPAGQKRDAGSGGILAALRALHPHPTTAAACPPPATRPKPPDKPGRKHRKHHAAPKAGGRQQAGAAHAEPGEHTASEAARSAPGSAPRHATGASGEGRAKQIATAVLLAKT